MLIEVGGEGRDSNPRMVAHRGQLADRYLTNGDLSMQSDFTQLAPEKYACSCLESLRFELSEHGVHDLG
jgi:hypothetical protein